MENEPYADVRDMYMAHTVFRREFGLAPALVRGVAAGDVGRAGVVADHLQLVDTLLEHHHQGEDKHLWPRLLDRAGADAAPVVLTMESQHGEIGKALTEMRGQAADWRVTADPGQGEALAGALDRLVGLLAEHLAVEEDRALPVIERHITAAEWESMVAEGAGGFEPEQMPLLFGLMAYEGDPGTVRDVVATMPAEIRPVIGELAGQAYAQYAERVHGTATPQRIGGRR